MSFNPPLNTWAEAERAKMERRRDEALIANWLKKHEPRRFAPGTSGDFIGVVDWLVSIGFDAMMFRRELRIRHRSSRVKIYRGQAVWDFVDGLRAERGLPPLQPVSGAKP